MFHVARSESTSVGRAPRYVTAFAEAMNVNVGTKTSSSGPTPTTRSAT
jgi:hypothetical protein